MEPITAKRFYDSLKKTLKEDEARTVENYCYTKAWTDYLADKLEKILRDEFQLKTNREYFRIDMIGWSGCKEWEDKENNSTYQKHVAYKKYEKNSILKLNECNWNLEIAIEYENNSHDWMDEVIKLCHIKCGLKVLIAYSDMKSREQDEEKLKLAAKHMKNLTYSRPSANESFLIVLGNCNNDREYQSMADLNLIPYHYVHGCFERLPV